MESNQKEQIQILLNQDSAKASVILRAVLSEIGIAKNALMRDWGITPPTCSKYLNDIMMLNHYDLVFLASKLKVEVSEMHNLQRGVYHSAQQFIEENNIVIY